MNRAVLFGFGLLSCVSTVDERNRPCPCSPGWTCCAAAAVCVPSSERCPAVQPNPSPLYRDLPPGTAIDLGDFRCVSTPSEPVGNCRRATDDASLEYDPLTRRLWLIGAGNTDTDSLFSLDPATGRWTQHYDATPCSARTAANHDPSIGAWKTGPAGPWPRPTATQPKDQVVFVPELGELILISRRPLIGGGCTQVNEANEAGTIAHWSVDAGVWSFSEALVDAQPDYPAAGSAWEWDPLSRLVVGIGQAGLFTYDPFLRVKRRVLAQLDRNDNAFGNALVAGDDVHFYFDALRHGVFRFDFDRKSPVQSTLSSIATPAYPTTAPPGMAWDSLRHRAAGAVERGRIWTFDPATNSFEASPIRLTDGGVADVGTMQAHTIDYDPHDDVFIFVTTLESGYRTWAYRPR